MKKVANNKDALKELKNMKKGETLIWDERFENKNMFKITNGNLQVLKIIPDMMTKPSWRKKLRMLVLEYLTDRILRKNEIQGRVCKSCGSWNHMGISFCLNCKDGEKK